MDGEKNAASANLDVFPLAAAVSFVMALAAIIQVRTQDHTAPTSKCTHVCTLCMTLGVTSFVYSSDLVSQLDRFNNNKNVFIF